MERGTAPAAAGGDVFVLPLQPLVVTGRSRLVLRGLPSAGAGRGRDACRGVKSIEEDL